MACIGTLKGGFEMVCGAPAVSFNQIRGAKLLNASDIASFTVNSSNGVATITRVVGAIGYGVTTVNNALTLSVGMKSQDITPGAFDVTIGFKVLNTYGGTSGMSSDYAPMGSINTLAKLELVVAVDHTDGYYRVYGLGAPLVCLEYNMDSTEDGYVTLTYGVEDWQVGTTIHPMDKAGYDALSVPQPEPEPEPKP